MKRTVIECDVCGEDITDYPPEQRRWPVDLRDGFMKVVISKLTPKGESPEDLCSDCRMTRVRSTFNDTERQFREATQKFQANRT